MRTEMLRLEGISKTQAGVSILDNFRMNLYKGEILGLIGLSGTGKTAIANILAGMDSFDAGRIYFKEELISPVGRGVWRHPKIFTIHHTVRLVPQLSIADNIFVIKNNSFRKIIINQKAVYQEAKLLLKEVGLDVSPHTTASELTLAQQHLVELAKAIASRAEIIILDDIAESYTIREIEKLKETINIMRDRGISFIYESRKPDELIGFADRITILRDGKNIKTFYRDEYDKHTISSLLVGSEFKEQFKRDDTAQAEIILRMEDICTDKLQKLCFALRKGEVLGVLDLENKATKEIYNLLSGIIQPTSGFMYLNEEKISVGSINQAISCGIGLMPEDAANRTLFQNMTYAENLYFLIMKKMRGPFMSINKRVLNYLAKEYKLLLSMEENDPEILVKAFDAYARQKLMFHRWLLNNPKVLVCANLSAMLDIVTTEISYSFINEFAKKGVGVLLVTSDLQEANSICDRILVISGKRVKGEYDRDSMQSLSIENLY